MNEIGTVNENAKQTRITLQQIQRVFTTSLPVTIGIVIGAFLLVMGFAMIKPKVYQSQGRLYYSLTDANGAPVSDQQVKRYQDLMVNAEYYLLSDAHVEPIVKATGLSRETIEKDLVMEFGIHEDNPSNYFLFFKGKANSPEQAMQLTKAAMDTYKADIERETDAYLEIANEPVENPVPAAPNKKLFALIGVVFGLFCGFLYLVIRVCLDPGLYSVEQVEDYLDIPCLDGHDPDVLEQIRFFCTEKENHKISTNDPTLQAKLEHHGFMIKDIHTIASCRHADLIVYRIRPNENKHNIQMQIKKLRQSVQKPIVGIFMK